MLVWSAGRRRPQRRLSSWQPPLLSSPLTSSLLARPPQPPMLRSYGGTLLPYFLEEEHGWQATLDHLRDQVETARG